MTFLISFPSGKSVKELESFLEIIVDEIIEGKMVAFPTDSVYGIGGDPLNLTLIERIYNIKVRERLKGFLLLVLDYEEASKIVEFNDIAKKLAKHFWPGQLTIILKRKIPNIIPLELTAFQDTIGLRVPNNEIVLTILEKLKSRGHFGGLIGTSANYSGEPPAASAAEIAQIFLGKVDIIINNGAVISNIPSTIVDCTTNELRILRSGNITEKEIKDFLLNETNIEIGENG